MSNTFHPGVTKHMAEQLAQQIGHHPLVVAGLVRRIEPVLNDHACRAAGISGNDPSSIYRSIWYRSDGWGHGGSAVTWQERAEELEAELSVKNALLDRAKPYLEAHLDALGYTAPDSARKADQLGKLLTDIEHL